MKEVRRALSNGMTSSNWRGKQAFVLLCLMEAGTRLPCSGVKSRAEGKQALPLSLLLKDSTD